MPNVPPTINVELEVESGEVENYEVGTRSMAFITQASPDMAGATADPRFRKGHASVSFLRLC